MIFDPVFAEERVSFIPIVGFGGIGKTSLAQLVFNDEKLKTHFELMKWACVPEVDNQFEVMRKICNSLTGLNCDGLSLEQVQSKIRESISNKRYLLVLDDIWDESRDRWLQVKSLLDCGCKGSKIIVTTRSNVVANVVGTCPAYDLGLLTDEESWELFKRLELKEGQEESNPNFTRIGKDIVGRCGRVPLAIRVIGSLLYSKDTEQEWLLFRDGHLAKTKVTEDDNIMPILKLSYDFLPSPLKQCFAYCSLFQKDYEFEKNELVHLWMAQGYIEASKESIGLEEVGDLYFLELLRRNFFQDARVDDKTDIDTARLRHLRYLNLRYSSIKCLSDAITKLENLQTLNLYKCSNLEQLPNGFTKLANLRHLGISKCFILREMPSGFEKMRSLRELNTFIVGKNNGVDALATLELRGNLEIRFHTWRRNTVLEARRVKLDRQEQLTGLTLDLEICEYEVTPTSNDMELLFECLMFPPNLRSLEVKGFGGERFPIRMAEGLLCLLPRLVYVTIQCCEYCRQIPRFSNLPHLKSLSLDVIAVEV
uniref:NB-ARC domain-containing protein n=1 Tax=Chenopodium quinoa TaxID=63459 RepID=A0A803L2Z8_CHEQI